MYVFILRKSIKGMSKCVEWEKICASLHEHFVNLRCRQMSSSFKFVLPLLLGTSPLLLAAGQPAANYTSLSCGLDVAAERSDATLTATYREPDVTAEVAARPIAHPIVTSLRALVTSENEWSSFLDRAVATATGYWRENPDYSMQFATEAANEIANRPECMAQNPAVKSTVVEGTANKEEPGAGAAKPTGEVVDEIPVLEPATGEVLPAQRVEPIGADIVTPAPQTAEPQAVESQSPAFAPASTLVPAPPAVDPTAVPNVDPNNFTPNSQVATPFDGTVPDSLGNLPDGSYRYLQGRFENLPYSDDVLRASGRSIFLLTKTGNEVVGRLTPRLGEAGVCIDGELNGDIVMGTAYSEVAIIADAVEVDAAEVDTAEVDAAEKAATPFDTFDSSALEVNGRVAAGEQTVAANVSLNLDEFSRINAGSVIAPTTCTAPEQTNAEATN